MSEEENEETAKEKFMTLRRVFILNKNGKLSDTAVLHFLAGFCNFAPKEDEVKLLHLEGKGEENEQNKGEG